MKVSEDLMNMADRDVFVKLPEFWEHAAAAWFAHVEAHFACQQVRDRDLKYFHMVAALGSSTSSRLVGFIADPHAMANMRRLRPFSLRHLAYLLRRGPASFLTFKT